jgi:hypothetical protein
MRSSFANIADPRHRAMTDLMTIAAARFLRAHQTNALPRHEPQWATDHRDVSHASQMLGKILSAR